MSTNVNYGGKCNCVTAASNTLSTPSVEPTHLAPLPRGLNTYMYVQLDQMYMYEYVEERVSSLEQHFKSKQELSSLCV